MDARLDYVFEFLSDLARQNTRAWMHTRINERRFDVVQRTMQRWVAMLLLDMQDIEDTHGIRPKDCLYRIWRDTRFSADKTPCKTYLSFLIRKGGRRNEDRAAYYVQIGPGGQSFAGGGVYMPEPGRLKRIRERIATDGPELARIVGAPGFRRTFGDLESLKLKTMPREYRTADLSPAVRDLVRHTSWVAGRQFPDDEVLGRDFDRELMRTFAVLKPFNDWLNGALAAG